MTEEAIRAKEMVNLYGYKNALLLVVEFNIEYINYPNQERLDFYKGVKREIEKIGYE